MIEIVAVDGADVIEAELLEPHAALPEMARIFLDAGRPPLPALRQALGELLGDVADIKIGAARGGPREIGRHGTRRRGDRHVVVVEHNDQSLVACARIVHRLVGHAGAHGAVADHAHDVVRAALQVAGNRHAEAGRDRGRGVRGAERVVLALGALRKSGEAAALAQRADAVAPPGQDLVRVGLMAHVPDESVVRRVEQVMERDGELDDAEPGAQVPAGDRHRADELVAQLARELRQARIPKAA